MIECTILYPPHVGTAVPVNGDKGEAAAGGTGMGGEDACQQHGWDGCACSHWHMSGDRFPPRSGECREKCVFTQKNGSAVSCAVGIGKHHVEEQRGNLGGIRKPADKEQLVLDKADGSSPSLSV